MDYRVKANNYMLIEEEERNCTCGLCDWCLERDFGVEEIERGEA